MEAAVRSIWTPSFAACDEYMGERSGKYEYRAIRYRKAADWLIRQGLDNDSTLCDVGAGWTEFDYCLRKEYDWRGRYIPLDGGISRIDLNSWTPEREVDFYVALEILEHLDNPYRLILEMQASSRGIVLSVPDPDALDIYALDETHCTEIRASDIEPLGFSASSELLYGGVFSDGVNDAIMGYWAKE